MQIHYSQHPETLHIEFRAVEVAETRDLDGITILDLDRDGNIAGITVEHPRKRADIPKFSCEQVAA